MSKKSARAAETAAFEAGKAIIFQYAEGEIHRAMLDASYARHAEYATRHGIEFESETVDGPVNAAFGWLRISKMLQALKAGYEYAIFLETDTLIMQDVDLRSAFTKPLAMVWGRAPGGEPEHFNCGVIFARHDPHTIAFLEAVMALQPEPEMIEESGPWWTREHCVQTVINRLLSQPEWEFLCEKLTAEWNSVAGIHPAEGAIIRAWHGLTSEAQKLAAMQAALTE